jgi:hypothetical protein
MKEEVLFVTRPHSFFLWYWNLNLGPSEFSARALPLELCPQVFYTSMIGENSFTQSSNKSPSIMLDGKKKVAIDPIVFFFFAVLEFELRVYTLSHSTTPFL